MKVNEKIETYKGVILDVVITKEKIDGKEFFVAQGIQLDVASQGLSLEEAIENLRDAAEIVLEDSQEKRITFEKIFLLLLM